MAKNDFWVGGSAGGLRWPAAVLSPAHAQWGTAAPNNTPLSFGMNADEASRALGTTLNYVRGRRGDELYLALPNVKGAALSSRQRRAVSMQLRRMWQIGRLEGRLGFGSAVMQWIVPP